MCVCVWRLGGTSDALELLASILQLLVQRQQLGGGARELDRALLECRAALFVVSRVRLERVQLDQVLRQIDLVDAVVSNVKVEAPVEIDQVWVIECRSGQQCDQLGLVLSSDAPWRQRCVVRRGVQCCCSRRAYRVVEACDKVDTRSFELVLLQYTPVVSRVMITEASQRASGRATPTRHARVLNEQRVGVDLGSLDHEAHEARVRLLDHQRIDLARH